MFGCDLGLVAACAYITLEQEIQKQRAFEELCNSLPKEQADKLRLERKKELESERKHQRNLEVAREGRSLNFWGDR